ncbi:MAG: CaiB/BaiF CoA transferase family protein [Rhodospirillales bacterium]
MSPAESDTPRAGPLAGLLVVDLTRVLAGPYATMMLADLGARVIKVEAPETGDDSRSFGPFINGKSGYYMSMNRGKESIALNLKDAADRKILDGLLDHADIVAENFRPGTMEKLGYGWETLHKTRPKLIYAAISGFGHTGPYSARAAYDLVAQAMGGIMSVTGHPDSPPTKAGASIGDMCAGVFGVVGILAALNERRETGLGVKVDVAMLDSQVAILENHLVRCFAAGGKAPEATGNRHPSISPFDSFACADGDFIVAVGNDALFKTFSDTIGRPGLAADARFASNVLRNENHAALKTEMEDAFRAHGVDHWLEILTGAGVPCGPINTIDKVMADPQVNARNMVAHTDDPVAGPVMMAGNPVKISGFDDPKTRRPAPGLDADRARILAEFNLEPGA